MANKKILGVILARGGSKAIIKKNLSIIGGHPLIAYTIYEALQSEYINRVIVSSDDDDIRAIAIQYGAEAPFRRPENLSIDTANSTITGEVDGIESGGSQAGTTYTTTSSYSSY